MEPVALELRLYHNGGAVWGPVAVDLSQTSDGGTLRVPLSAELEVEAGDVLRLVAYDRDSLGREWLERICEFFVEAGPEGPLLAARDQIIPYRGCPWRRTGRPLTPTVRTGAGKGHRNKASFIEKPAGEWFPCRFCLRYSGLTCWP